jgi:hypothetical protein
MYMQVEVYVMYSRYGCMVTGISADTDLGALQKEMKFAYESTLKDADQTDIEFRTCYGERAAVIDTSGDCFEWVITAHTVELGDPVSFTLPNGVVIAASLNGDVADEQRGEWKSIDITATQPGGVEDNLCAIDWEAGRGAKALVFAPDTDDPIYERSYGDLLEGN